MTYDLVIKGGTVATASDTFAADIGVKDGKIAAIAASLDGGGQTIDATGKLVLPGAIETHAHIEQESATGAMTSDDYRTGSISALYGGNTSFVPFAAQHRGQSVTDTLALYHERAKKSVIDYSFHLIVTDPTEEILTKELPEAFAGGITSFKVFLTYDKMIVPDEAMLDILVTARKHGALTMVHAENNALIKWMVKRLVETGHTAPKYHAVSHPAAAEAEAINRAITLATFVGAPLLIVHVSTEEGANLVADARRAGHAIFGETCPQYLFLTRDDLDKPGAEGGKFCCSPPLRDVQTQKDLWRHLQAGTFHLWSSDHAPYRFDETGKLSAGPNPRFNQIANGMPGIAMRVPAPDVGRRAQGPPVAERLRRADLHQRRQAVRDASAEGHDRGGVRRRHRDLGPGGDADRHPGRHARRDGLHPVRGDGDHRLADDGHHPRQGRPLGRRAPRRAGRRTVHRPQALRLHGVHQPSVPGARSGRVRGEADRLRLRHGHWGPCTVRSLWGSVSRGAGDASRHASLVFGLDPSPAPRGSEGVGSAGMSLQKEDTPPAGLPPG